MSSCSNSTCTVKAREDQTLDKHLEEVNKLGNEHLENLSLNFHPLLRAIMDCSNHIVTYTHDIGKATSFFQDYIKNNKAQNSQLTRNPKLKNHSLFSSLYTVSLFIVLQDFLVDSVKETRFGEVSVKEIFRYFGFLSQLIVRCHHSSSLKDLITVANDLFQQEILKLHKIRFNNLNKECVRCILLNNLLPKVGSIEYKEKNLFNLTPSNYDDIVEKVTYTVERIIEDKKYKNNIYSGLIGANGSLDSADFDLLQQLFFCGKILFSILIKGDIMSATLGLCTPKSPVLSIEDFKQRLHSYLVDKKFYLEKEEYPKFFSSLNQRRRFILNLLMKYNLNHTSSGSIFLLSVPTGFGKTLSSLYFASRTDSPQGNKNTEEFLIHPRLIYSLPFLSIIEQTQDEVQRFITKTKKPDEVPTGLLLVHHHLTNPEYIQKDEEDYRASVSQFLIDSWNSQYVITTFNQLLNAIFKTTKKDSLKFSQILNTTWILDEVQSIPLKYWKLLESVFLLMTTKFHNNLILMSATLPKIIDTKQETQNSGIINLLITEDTRKRLVENLSRISLEFFGEIEQTDFFSKMSKLVKEQQEQNILIVLNTRRSAQELFKYLKIQLRSQKNSKLIFLAATMIPKHKKRVITNVKELIEESKKNSDQVIMVATQCIEAGIDIDFDLVIRDFSPLDNIIQVAGRCNRNNSERKGRVIVYQIYKKHNTHEAFLADYIYDSHLLILTKNLIYGSKQKLSTPIIVPECKIYDLVKQHYNNIVDFFSKGSMASEIDGYKEHIKHFRYNSLSESFKLIEDQKAFSFFIEIDEKASNLLKKIKELYKPRKKLDQNYFDQILLIKKCIQNYIVVAYLNQNEREILRELESFRYFHIIPKEKIKHFYSEEIGLCINKELRYERLP